MLLITWERVAKGRKLLSASTPLWAPAGMSRELRPGPLLPSTLYPVCFRSTPLSTAPAESEVCLSVRPSVCLTLTDTDPGHPTISTAHALPGWDPAPARLGGREWHGERALTGTSSPGSPGSSSGCCRRPCGTSGRFRSVPVAIRKSRRVQIVGQTFPTCHRLLLASFRKNCESCPFTMDGFPFTPLLSEHPHSAPQ